MNLKIQIFVCYFSLISILNYGLTQDTIQTNIIIDSLDNEVYYLTDKNEKPMGYYSPIFTPVCVDGTCYPIRINLFWNLSGAYQKYTLDANEILTKVEHLPFTEFDYGLLHRVIANPQSALANYSIYDLVDTIATSKNETKVDGITGATRPELQGAFVPDALYTSYTLWHLARKPQLLIANFTQIEILGSRFFNWVLNNPNLGGQKLALQCLIQKSSTSTTVQSLTQIIDSTDNELTVECLRLIPKVELTLAESRLLLANTYSRSDNASVKKAILEHWQNNVKLTALELETLAHELGNQWATFLLEKELLSTNREWTEDIYFILLDKVNNTSNIMRKEKIKRLLYSREADFPKKFRRK